MAGRFGGFRVKLKDKWVHDDLTSLHQAVIYKFIDPADEFTSRTQFIGSALFAIALGLCDLADAVREHGTRKEP